MKTPKVIQFSFSQFAMVRTVVAYCTSADNQPITDLVPKFSEAINNLKGKTIEIETLLGLSNQNIKGVAMHKRDLKKILANNMMEISGPLCAFAKATRNFPLLTSAKSSFTRNFETRDAKLVAAASDLINLANPLLGSLAGFNITAASLVQLAADRDNFDNTIATPRVSLIERSANRQQRSDLLKEAMDVIRQFLDPLSYAFKALNHENFLQGYLRARRQQHYGLHHTRMTARLFLGDSNLPLINASVQVQNTQLTASADQLGSAHLTNIPFGMQSLIITSPALPHPVISGPYRFKKGKATYLTIHLNAFDLPANSFAHIPATEFEQA